METTAGTLADGTQVERDELAREFETRLAESSTLAFRVAYSVLRHAELGFEPRPWPLPAASPPRQPWSARL